MTRKEINQMVTTNRIQAEVIAKLEARVKRLEAALEEIEQRHKLSSNPYREGHAESCSGCIARKALEDE